MSITNRCGSLTPSVGKLGTIRQGSTSLKMRVCSASPRVCPRAVSCVRALERLSLLCRLVGMNSDFFLPRGSRQDQVGRFLRRNATEAVLLRSHGRRTHCISPELESLWRRSRSKSKSKSVGDDAFTLDPRTLVGHSGPCRRLILVLDGEKRRLRMCKQASPRSDSHLGLYTRAGTHLHVSSTSHFIWWRHWKVLQKVALPTSRSDTCPCRVRKQTDCTAHEALRGLAYEHA